jgi:hypothetical protein
MAMSKEPNGVPAAPVKMTPEQHKARHVQLHRALDELLADFILHNPGKYPSKMPVLDLMRWSHAQTLKPTEDP